MMHTRTSLEELREEMLLDAHTHFYLDAHTYFSLEELREELNKNKHNNLINKIQHGKE